MPASKEVPAVPVASPEPVAAKPTAVAVPAARPRKRGVLGLVLLTLLVVGLTTLTVGSTLVALKSIKQRDAAQKHFAAALHAVDELAIAAANVKPAKKELLQPAIDYYQQFAQGNANDETVLAERTSANFRLAALFVRQGSKDGAGYLGQGVSDLNKLVATKDLDPQTVPSLQECTLRATSPIEWAMVKGADQAYGLTLLLAAQGALGSYQKLSSDFPAVVSFRDDTSALLKLLALLNAQLPGGPQRALPLWLQARDVLETLVRDQPDNVDYKTRLIESLVNAGRIQKAAERDAAITNLKRALELREQMASATPDDAALKKEADRLKTELEKLQAAAPAATAGGDQPAAEPTN